MLIRNLNHEPPGLEYFNKPECRDKAGHVCCEEPFVSLSGLPKFPLHHFLFLSVLSPGRFIKSSLDYIPEKANKTFPAAPPPHTPTQDIALGVCETDQEPDSCPPYYTPPPDEDGGDGPSPGNSIDPPGNNGGDRGNGNGWWPPTPGPWPNRPTGLWKLKKIRRGCDAAAAAAATPPHSLKPSSSSFSSDNYNDDGQVVAALAETEKAPTSTNIQKHYTTESEIEVDYAHHIVPSWVDQDSFS